MGRRVHGRKAIRTCWQKLRSEEVKIFASLGVILRHKRRKRRYYLPQVARRHAIVAHVVATPMPVDLPPPDLIFSGRAFRF